MIKKNKSRVGIIIECTMCRKNKNPGVSRYLTCKSLSNNPNKLMLLKYCKFCKKHTEHIEVKRK